MISYGRQSISEEDIAAVVAVLRSDYLTQGPVVAQFEAAVCEYTGAAHAVAVNSGTAALHVACRALGLGPGDVLWTTPVTFVASANCALYCGAEIDFVDIDPQTYTMSVPALAEKLARAQLNGRLPKIVVPVHMCGLSCDMEAIATLSEQYGFAIIEDACHAIGGRYQDITIGSCRYADITVFSFHPVKTITTGEGGMAMTNNRELAEKMRLLRSHGITRDEQHMTNQPEGPWYYEQIELGYNYRMTDFQAALGMSQLSRLDDFIARRNAIAQRYDAELAGLALAPQARTTQGYSAFHLYVVQLDLKRLNKTRLDVVSDLQHNGILTNVHYIPVHLQPWYRRLGFQPGDFPQAEHYYQAALSLPIYPDLLPEQQDWVVGRLVEVMQS